MIIESASALTGTIRVPGDKSIAHRALILGAAADGEQTVEGLPDSADVRSTIACLQALGAHVERGDDSAWRVRAGAIASVQRRHARGTEPANRPNGSDTGAEGRRAAEASADAAKRLDAGNSGTAARLLCGLVAGLPITAIIDGDDSLRRRPMQRIVDPLTDMGARFDTNEGHLPVTIRGGALRAIDYTPPVASAQVKSAILIAGLHADGRTTVREPIATRDHTERMLAAMDVPIVREGCAVTVSGDRRPRGTRIVVPGDISSAAFFIVAATIVPRSEIRASGVGMNPARIGFMKVLETMGAHIMIDNVRDIGGEPSADLIVRSSPLRAATIGGEQIPSLIDELPVLAVAATQAEGETVVTGAEELRHKESDRIAAIVTNLRTLGADVEERRDGFVVRGPTPLRAARVGSHGDHRIAMAMAVAALVAGGKTTIDGGEIAAISYPGFFDDLRRCVR